MDWAYTGIAVLLALAAVYLVLRGDLLVTLVCIAASASVASVEIDRALIGEETLRALGATPRWGAAAASDR